MCYPNAVKFRQKHFCRQLGYLHVPCRMLSGVLLTMLAFPKSKLINQAKGAGEGGPELATAPVALCLEGQE